MSNKGSFDHPTLPPPSFASFNAAQYMLSALRKRSVRSAMKLDPAVIKLLSLDPQSTTVSSAGGGGCSSASTSKITEKGEDGEERCFFMKTGKGREAEVMFEGLLVLFF